MSNCQVAIGEVTCDIKAGRDLNQSSFVTSVADVASAVAIAFEEQSTLVNALRWAASSCGCFKKKATARTSS